MSTAQELCYKDNAACKHSNPFLRSQGDNSQLSQLMGSDDGSVESAYPDVGSTALLVPTLEHVHYTY